MLSALSRSVHLVRRASASAALFGAGYCCAWSQGREESPDKLAAWAGASSFVFVTRSLRLFARALPEGANWPKEKLLLVEGSELRLLHCWIERCKERGTNSALLQFLLLNSLCEHVEEDSRGPAVQGLCAALTEGQSANTDQSSPKALAISIDAAVTGSSSLPGRAAILPRLSAVLEATLELGNSELGAEGLLCLARAATISASWLATVRRPGPSTEKPFCEEEEQAIEQHLCKVWQVLRSSKAQLSSWSLQASDRRRALAAALSELETVPAGAAEQLRPAKDFLPAKLKAQMASSEFSASSTPFSAWSQSSSSAFAGKTYQLAQWIAWAMLLCGALLSLSEDGLGILRFHLLPPAWRAVVQEQLQLRALRVEELLANHASLPEPPETPTSLETALPATYLQPELQLNAESFTGASAMPVFRAQS
eukprot:TRINITY_DN13419_c0_g1_i1.p1 TRINITY_DN13419_c0_g1~~TRINITY_DN13419_c0_g1_i1.p1  ORF type:complete len:425 (+),score=94.25 TRINITY_DN13419_c0_g1_i1:2-1276(+)